MEYADVEWRRGAVRSEREASRWGFAELTAG
jgi:hypothetical protein